MQEINKLTDQTTNPYYSLFYWVKGQIYDLKSLTVAVDFKEGINS